MADKLWYKKYPEKHLAKTRRWQLANRQKHLLMKREYALKGTYGITSRQYDQMLRVQGNKCAVCGSDNPQSRRTKRFFVDHDHKTGKIRGLLCHKCNLGLGLLEDVLTKAIAYLMDRTEGAA